MKERDEQVLLTMIASLVEVACRYDKPIVVRTFDLTEEQWGAYRFYDLRPEDKIRLGMEVVAEYSYGDLSEDVKSLILQELKEVFGEETFESPEDKTP